MSSSFMNPADSRNGTNRNTVRIFGPDKLSKPAALEKWDRVKIVCAQPFNKVEKHCFKVIVSFFNFKMCNDTALLFTERYKSTCSCIGMSCLFLFLVFLISIIYHFRHLRMDYHLSSFTVLLIPISQLR